jgi:tRNA nucleotidyltransferase/poly(A) polymerase
MNLQLDSELLQLLELVRELASGTRVYLVGGAIRDLLLGCPTQDLDFVQPHGSIQLAKAVSRRLNGAMYTLDDVRHSARVILRQGEQDEQVLDFTSFIGENLEEDLRQRDFTINAMALDLEALAEVIDPLGGEADLEAKQIRLCGPDSLTADPLRVLRGVRLISSYNLRYEFEITAAMRVAIKRLGLVSGERIRDELFKCLAVPNFEAVAALFSEFGVFDELRLLTFGVDPSGRQSRQVENETLTFLARLSNNPEGRQQVAHGGPNPDFQHLHAFQVMLDEPLQGGRKRRHLLLLCSILLHIHPAFDVDETSRHELLPGEFSEQITQALLIGQKEKAYFKAVSGGFLRLADLSRYQPGKLDYYRFFREFGSYGLDSALLAMAEVKSQEPLLQFNSEICREVFHTWFTEQARTVNPPRLVDGDLLQRELEIGPGVKIGNLLEEIREQQVLGKINTTAEAIAFAQENTERNA